MLVGPTASGKSELAVVAAEAHGDLEIVTADSMQVYVGMDIGTATPPAEVRRRVPHHVVDVVDPAEEFTVADHQRLARAAIADIEARGRRALVVGGTALYVRALTDDLEIPGRWPDIRAELEGEPDTGALHRRLVSLDPVAAARMEPTNRRRIIRALEVTLGSGRPFSSWGPGLGHHPPTPFRLLGVWLPRAVVDARIAARYRSQLEAGFLEEVRALADRPAGLSRTARQALGYRELLAHLAGELDLDAAVELAVRRTRRFARRQRAWFRRDPRIRWMGHAADPAALADLVVEATAP